MKYNDTSYEIHNKGVSLLIELSSLNHAYTTDWFIVST